MTTVLEQNPSISTQVIQQVLLTKAEKVRSIAAELHELAAAGVPCPYSALELLELEQNGLVFDFDTGVVFEVT